MEAALCIAKANIQKVMDCSYNVQEETIDKVAKTNILISECITPTDKCKPCAYRCQDTLTLPASDLVNKVMTNPFLGFKEAKCLILCAN